MCFIIEFLCIKDLTYYRLSLIYCSLTRYLTIVSRCFFANSISKPRGSNFARNYFGKECFFLDDDGLTNRLCKTYNATKCDKINVFLHTDFKFLQCHSQLLCFGRGRCMKWKAGTGAADVTKPNTGYSRAVVAEPIRKY